MSKKSESLPPEDGAIFTRSQRSRLEELLGAERATRIVPKFEKAVRDYPKADAYFSRWWNDYSNEAATHVRVATTLETCTHKLLEALEAAEPLLEQARERKYVGPRDEAEPTPPSLKDLLLKKKPGERASLPPDPPEAVLRILMGFLNEWRRIAFDWKTRAQPDTGRKRGRKIGARRRFMQWVGGVLKAEGVELSTYPDGQFARVLGILFEAGGIPAPIDLYRELKWLKAYSGW